MKNRTPWNLLTLSTFATLSALTLGQSAAHATSYTVDPAHSSIGFTAKHLLITNVHGNFTDFIGTFDFDPKRLSESKVEFVIKTASITTHVAQRDDHLRTADFFDVANFPEAKFVSTGLKLAGGSYMLSGDLTIRDVTKNVRFKVNYIGKATDPMSKVEKVAFRAAGTINRKDFGVSYGDNTLVSDRVRLNIDIEAAETVAVPTPLSLLK